MTAAADAYPVDVTFREDAAIGRLWGIPLIGFIVRAFVAIPLWLVVVIMGIATYVAAFLLWIPVLLYGRQAGLVYAVVGGYLRCVIRLQAYVFLLAGKYPPLAPAAPQPDEDAAVRIDEGQLINRLWGIPLLGLIVRSIILIPHFIVLWVLSIVAAIFLSFTWIPVLVLGRQAELVYTVVGGWMRWYLRVGAYLLLLSDRYPPFRLGH